MGQVRAHVMVTLDGYLAGPDMSPEQPFGSGMDGFLDWIFKLETFRQQIGMDGGKTGPSNDVIRETQVGLGATIIGRNMFGGSPGPWGPGRWGDEPWRGWWGDNPPYHTPVFVLTHHAREPLEMEGGTTFYFITEGIEVALERAREAAGDLDVRIGGGAATLNQYLAAGHVDELELHLVPKIAGAGQRLFENLGATRPQMELVRTVEAPEVTHLKYRILH